MLRYLLLVLLLLAAAAAAVYFVSEGRRFGARNAHLERHNRVLQQDLAEALRQRDEVNRFLAQRVEEMRAEREERARRSREAFRSMPEGVRLALVALNRCLGEDGFPEVRFLRARELGERVLLDVELLVHDRDTMASSVYLAGRVTVHLDRARGAITLRLFDGHRFADGASQPFPEAGEVLVFADVDGAMWEGRVGYLLEAENEYPQPDPEPAPGERLDRHTRQVWLSRLERLLRDAGTDLTYRVDRFEGLDEGAFTDVMLLGYERGTTLKMAIEAARLAVVLDERAATVELLLQEGVLRKSGGDTRIGDQGYRILLPAVSRADAIEVMMGMVVRR